MSVIFAGIPDSFYPAEALKLGEVPLPRFCVSVASKELSSLVSGLESTLTDIPISVDSKGVRLHKDCAIPMLIEEDCGRMSSAPPEI